MTEITKTVDWAKRRGIIAWSILILATLASYFLSQGTAPQAVMTKMALAGVLAITFIKVRLIIRAFMEAGSAMFPVAIVFDLWILVVMTILTYLFCFQ